MADVGRRDGARQRGWSADWLNDAVNFHLAANATIGSDHVEFGTFPRSDADPGLIVYVPTASYMLALKVKALRVLDPLKGQQEAEDIRSLMKVLGLTEPEDAVRIMARYFPRSAVDPTKHLFLLRSVLNRPGGPDAPDYPR